MLIHLDFRQGGRRLWLACLFAMLAASTGCVERRYTIRSDPPGALAIVNGEEIGPTPVSRPFTFYGDRRIKLQREGYEPMDVVEPIKAPWYDNMLTEFFTENLVPYTFRDEREYNYKLRQTEPADTNKLLQDSEALRAEASRVPKPRPGGLRGFFGLD